ncbi:MAG TPA: MarR family transcriptional regulator [Saprospiraceae bacterium]|mgnify:CR=1 FL=1|nr:MarR family transcriptional regulator [Saprospiraceae bacterium]
MNERTWLSAYLIERTARLLKQKFARLLYDNDIPLTVDQWIVLRELEQGNGITQLELSRICHKDAATLTRILDLLESKTFLKRVPNSKDRRSFHIYITETGKKWVDQIWPLVFGFREESFEGIPLTDLIILDAVLNRIYDNLSGVAKNIDTDKKLKESH